MPKIRFVRRLSTGLSVAALALVGLAAVGASEEASGDLVDSTSRTAPVHRQADGTAWAWPLAPDPAVVRGFEPPADPWGPGHRGVDLAGAVGQPVLAVASGTVTFAGQVGGRGVVVVSHGAIRSTYEPVAERVHRGQLVPTGTVLGTLTVLASHCLPAACLHLGARRGDAYLDPLSLLGDRTIRLKPLLGEPVEPSGIVTDPPRRTVSETIALGAGMGLAVGGA